MKTLLCSLFALSILTGCGNKLYSYRKTEKVDYAAGSAANHSNTTQPVLEKIHVVPNTAYLVSKPIKERAEPVMPEAIHPTSSVTVK